MGKKDKIEVEGKVTEVLKGSDYLDALSKINTIIFDKTGTITTGEFSNYELEIIDKNQKQHVLAGIFLADGRRQQVVFGVVVDHGFGQDLVHFGITGSIL